MGASQYMTKLSNTTSIPVFQINSTDIFSVPFKISITTLRESASKTSHRLPYLFGCQFLDSGKSFTLYLHNLSKQPAFFGWDRQIIAYNDPILPSYISPAKGSPEGFNFQNLWSSEHQLHSSRYYPWSCFHISPARIPSWLFLTHQHERYASLVKLDIFPQIKWKYTISLTIT